MVSCVHLLSMKDKDKSSTKSRLQQTLFHTCFVIFSV